MSPRPTIIDTDPGHDDALALLLALAAREELQLLGISSVAGNVRVAQTTVNALKICELAGRPEVPVHQGCPGPIIRQLRTAEFIHGPDGLGGMSLPDPVTPPAPHAAVPFLVESLRGQTEKSVTLCTLGPLTNVALALVMAPDIAGKVERLVMMGGSRDLGNITAAAEFNVYTDPHAAHIVLEAGLDVTLVGLNATHQAVATADRIAHFEAPGGHVSAQAVKMLRRERPGGTALDGDDHPTHDPCVIAAVLWPELFSTRLCRVDIELAEGPTVGRTTIDWWGRSGAEPNAAVVETIDADAMFQRMAACIHTLD